MKWSFLLFSSFLCLQAIAQYPATGNKARLGWQTTGDGLVYRGAIGDTATLDPSGLNNAWMLLDTANGNLYAYRAKAWRLVSGGGGSVSDTLAGEVKGPLDSTYIDTVANIIFTTTTDTTVGVGELEYNDTQGSLIQGLKGGNVTNVIGQQIHQRVTNATGAPLTKGTAVFLHGSQGNRITVRKALATVDSTSANTFGIVAESIADNQSGYVITEGLITNINTNALTEGAAVYLSPTVAGELTTTKPQAPQHTVYIGVCVKQNAGSGELFVKIRNGQELDELHDVRIDSLASNASLYYNAAQGVWRDTTAAALKSDISGTTNYLAKFTGANTVGNSQLFDNGTNVGLGNTSPISGNGGGLTIGSPSAGRGLHLYTSGSGLFMYPTGSSNPSLQMGSSDADSSILYYTYFNYSHKFFTTNVERFRISHTGNVGIATSSPSRPLHVAGTTAIRIPVGTTAQRPSDGENGDLRYSTTFNNIEFYDGSRGLWERPLVGTVANKKVAFALGDTLTSNTNFHWDNTNTRLGIGNAAPDSTLTVTGGIRTTTSISTNSDATINNIRIGKGSGNVSSNIVIGLDALVSNTSGGLNIAIGNKALRDNLTAGSNSAIGGEALMKNTTGIQNTAIASYTLSNNTTGSNNTAIGSVALYNNTGSSNTAIGAEAMRNNTTGTQNTAISSYALFSNTTSSNNTAVGSVSLYANTGSDNSAIGAEAMRNSTTGIQNTAVGSYGLFSNTTGSNNTAVGSIAMYNNTTGSNNTAIGVEAGRFTNSGTNNQASTTSIYIGNDARPSASGNSNEIVIAYQGRGNGSNTTTIGNSSTTATILPAGSLSVSTTSTTNKMNINGNAVIGSSYIGTAAPADGLLVVGNVGIGASSVDYKLHCAGVGYFGTGLRVDYTAAFDANTIFQMPNTSTKAAKGYAWNTYSDARIKSNFDTIQNALQAIQALKPVYYDQHDSEVIDGKIKLQDGKTRTVGFIAQDVATVIPTAVQAGNDTQLWGMDYTKLIPYLTKAIQEQQAQIEALKKEIEALKNK